MKIISFVCEQAKECTKNIKKSNNFQNNEENYPINILYCTQSCLLHIYMPINIQPIC